MSRYDFGSEARVYRALVVQAGSNDLDAFDYLQRTSRADDGRTQRE